jgi:hypothetical protein
MRALQRPPFSRFGGLGDRVIPLSRLSFRLSEWGLSFHHWRRIMAVGLAATEELPDGIMVGDHRKPSGPSPS